MKEVKLYAVAIVALFITAESKAQISVNADVVSSYVWRGTKYSGVSVQPSLNFTGGGLMIGTWGSAGFDDFHEMDLYIKYIFSFGLNLGVTDYYFPGNNYFDYSTENGSHGFELNAGYTLGGLSLSANYMINEAGGAATLGGDKYFEAGWAFKHLSVFVGAGDGWHTPDNNFAVVNVGVSASKVVKINDMYEIPFKVSAILNPKTEQYYIVAGMSL